MALGSFSLKERGYRGEISRSMFYSLQGIGRIGRSSMRRENASLTSIAPDDSHMGTKKCGET